MCLAMLYIHMPQDKLVITITWEDAVACFLMIGEALSCECFFVVGEVLPCADDGSVISSIHYALLSVIIDRNCDIL